MATQRRRMLLSDWLGQQDGGTQTRRESLEKENLPAPLTIEMQGMEWLGEEEGWVGEDGYDYSQHMMDPGSGVFINAFLDKAIDDYKEKTECLASGQFEDVDEVFNDLDFEAESGEELEDNFVELAGGVDESELEADQQPSEEKQERGTEESDFEEDDVPPLVELRRNEAGGRDYGMLDEQFDHIMEGYEGDQIGELEEYDDVMGQFEVSQFEDCMDEFLATGGRKVVRSVPKGDQAPLSAAEQRVYIERALTDTYTDKYEMLVVEEKCDNWDCESIISCYSTTSNLPKVLDESTEQLRQIKITSSGIPQGVIGKPSNDLGSESSEEEDDEGIEFNEGKARSKAETVEEKRLRKKKLKLQRRQKRCMKKATKTRFRDEEARQAEIAKQMPFKNRTVIRF